MNERHCSFSVIPVLPTLPSIQRATMSAISVLISAGVVLGKVNLLQLVIMTLIEVTAFSATRLVSISYLHVSPGDVRRDLWDKE